MLALALVVGCAGGGAKSPTTAAICPPGASPDGGTCACRPDLRLLAGACVGPRLLELYCGPSRAAGLGGCVPRPPCERGRARDVDSGVCLARREVRAIAVSLGMRVVEEEVLVCPSGAELTFAGGTESAGGAPRLTCVSTAAPARERCAAGAVPGPGRGCTPVLERGTSTSELRVDVQRWLDGVVGVDAAAASPLLCDALGARLPEGVRLTVSLAFPDNDVSQVILDVRGVTTSGSSDAAATADLAAAVSPLVDALRSFGGTASLAAAARTVACRADKRGESGETGRMRPSPENDVGR